MSQSAFAQTKYVRKTNLPHVYINTYNNQAITSKTNYIYATMYYVDENDVVTEYDSLQIRGRGNSTWGLSKKPYKIKFAQKEKFLGTGYAKAKTWTLMANAGDKTLMRNAITSLMGDFLGMKNNPAHKFVDLTLNGRYNGNYQISDQVEVRPHRVNIMEQDYPLTPESNITGGYLLEVDGFHDGNCFWSSKNVVIRVHYPEEEEIDASQNTYIRDYVNTFEQALFSNNFTDEEKGYRQYVDSTSLINWFLATEISANIDGYYSTYFYKEQDDPHLYWGPLWDYDIAYNNDSRIQNTQTKLMDESGYGDAKTWVKRMWADPWFGRLVNERFAEVVDAGLESYMYTQIDSIAELINESQKINYDKWGISTRMYHEIVLYSSYDQYVRDLKNFINSHLSYLKTAFNSKKAQEPEKPTPPFKPEEFWYRIKNIGSGTMFDVSDGNMCAWNMDDSRDSQLWKIIKVGDYYFIINKESGFALTDVTQGPATATTNTGTPLGMAELNLDDEAQMWNIVPQGTDGRYNFVNVKTQHTANLQGGSSSNGTSVLSYDTSDRNASSNNRLWYIVKAQEIIPEDPDEPIADDIAKVEPVEYALGYNPATQTLHFGSETPELLTFKVYVYATNGTVVKVFSADENCSISDLPRGTYIIKWMVDGKSRSAKVAK